MLSFKEKCRQRGVNYWRALKRREAGMPEEKIFSGGFVRGRRGINPVTVNGVDYPNLREAVRQLNAPASTKTISRWIKAGVPPEEAFSRVPNCEQAYAGYVQHDQSLHAAIRTYGKDACVIEKIDSGRSKGDLEAKERYWIRELNTLIPHGFNISPRLCKRHCLSDNTREQRQEVCWHHDPKP